MRLSLASATTWRSTDAFGEEGQFFIGDAVMA